MTGQYPRATDTFIQREVAALRGEGVHVETFSIRKPADKENVGPEQRAECERTYYVLPACPWALFKSHAALLFGSPGKYFRALKTALTVRPPGVKAFVRQVFYFAEAGVVARRIRRLGVVHLHNHFSNSSCSVAMLAAEMGGFSFSFTMHGPAEFYEPKYWRLDEKIRRAKFVACISHFCRSQGMVFSPQEKWNKLHVVHCGVEPELFEPVRHEGPGSRLLFVGRLAGVKGLPVLLDALAELRRHRPGVTLTVAGDGPDRQKLEDLARRLGVADAVRFLGYQSQEQVRQLLAGTDVFVMASFAEGVPVVLMEAMAAGVPVVATRVAGIPELVEDGVSGFLVPPGEPASIIDRVDRLLGDPALRNTFGAAGREKVAREFNIATEAARLCTILTGALQGARPRCGRKRGRTRCPPGRGRPSGGRETGSENAVRRSRMPLSPEVTTPAGPSRAGYFPKAYETVSVYCPCGRPGWSAKPQAADALASRIKPNPNPCKLPLAVSLYPLVKGETAPPAPPAPPPGRPGARRFRRRRLSPRGSGICRRASAPGRSAGTGRCRTGTSPSAGPGGLTHRLLAGRTPHGLHRSANVTRPDTPGTSDPDSPTLDPISGTTPFRETHRLLTRVIHRGDAEAAEKREEEDCPRMNTNRTRMNGRETVGLSHSPYRIFIRVSFVGRPLPLLRVLRASAVSPAFPGPKEAGRWVHGSDDPRIRHFPFLDFPDAGELGFAESDLAAGFDSDLGASALAAGFDSPPEAVGVGGVAAPELSPPDLPSAGLLSDDFPSDPPDGAPTRPWPCPCSRRRGSR